jgi:hypothetical protein
MGGTICVALASGRAESSLGGLALLKLFAELADDLLSHSCLRDLSGEAVARCWRGGIASGDGQCQTPLSLG